MMDGGSERAFETAAVEAMRAGLPRVWYPFFARFPRPTGVQLAAWRPLVAGRDAVVCSPTASGKTEAVIAPLVERHAAGPGEITDRPFLLVVSPTRALVNDLTRRILGPLDRLGLRVHRRTGDHATLDRDRPPQVLVTTPESLDSLLVRHTDFLRDVRAIVLDELHILDNTARGDQTRILIERLRAVVTRGGRRPVRLQTVASSATVDAPEALAARYLEAGEAELVVVPGQRPIDARVVPTPRHADVLAVLAKLWGPPNARKILVFVPGRADVEDLTAAARELDVFRERVYAHHGSLSRVERERVEARFLADPSAICFATMTLELGIDIGDVDLVALLGPPPSVPSLLQRIGRGNRRTETTRVLALARDRADHVRFRHLLRAAREGDLLPSPYVFRPSVLAQQAVSLLAQSPRRYLTAAVLAERLPPALRADWPERALTRLLNELSRSQWFAAGRLPGQYVGGPQLDRALEYATLHSNLAAEAQTTEVVDEISGRSLGHVIAEEERPQQMALAGRTRAVVRQADGRLYVLDQGSAGAATRFAPRGPQILSRELATGLREFLEIPVGVLPLAEVPGGLALFHFQGSLAGALLARHLKKVHRWPIEGGTALAIVLEEPPPGLLETGAQPPLVTGEALAQTLPSVARRLSRLAAAGPFAKLLPLDWQLDFVRDVVPCEDIARTFREARIEFVPEGRLAETLADLVAVR